MKTPTQLKPAILGIIAAFLAVPGFSSAIDPMELVTYSSMRNQTFVNGFAVVNSNHDTLKTVYGPADANVVGYVDTADGRYYMSDWSFNRWMDDHVAPNWILPHAATCANPQPASFSFFDYLKNMFAGFF